MPDPIFSDPRLASVYDAFDDDRTDLDAYVALTHELEARSVVDIGCGTGTLAVRLAMSGLAVVGLDPAEASLQVARGKPGAELVDWRVDGASGLAEGGADLVVMTGNVAQVFLTDDEWAEALAAARRTLLPGGHLVFETRNPQARAWEGWQRTATIERREVPGIGLVEESFELLRVALPLVSLRYTYTFATDGARLVSDSVLRFRDSDEIQASLDGAGFTLTEVRDAPDRPGLELVIIARA